MWHDQGEWVTCRQYSILIFQYKSLVHLKCYILIQSPSQADIWLQRYKQFFKLKNNVKHNNVLPLLACNSKSIFPTSDSFPMIMSHICEAAWQNQVELGMGQNYFLGMNESLQFFSNAVCFMSVYDLRFSWLFILHICVDVLKFK